MFLHSEVDNCWYLPITRSERLHEGSSRAILKPVDSLGHHSSLVKQTPRLVVCKSLISDPVDNYVSMAQEACNMLLSNCGQESAGSTRTHHALHDFLDGVTKMPHKILGILPAVLLICVCIQLKSTNTVTHSTALQGH